jgi:hypothetical protein
MKREREKKKRNARVGGLVFMRWARFPIRLVDQHFAEMNIYMDYAVT